METEITKTDQLALRGGARVATWSCLAYTLFAIMLFVLAPRYWPYGATMIGLAAFGSVAAGRGRLPPP